MKPKALLIITVAITVLGVGFFTGTASSGSETRSSGANALLGTWIVHLTPIDPPQPEFEEMMTFTAGGGIVESNTFPFFLQGLTAGPGQGTWRYDGAHAFPFTFMKYLYAPNGAPVGTLKVAGAIEYNGVADTWAGPATVSICDVQAGNCNAIGTTQGNATRMTVGS